MFSFRWARHPNNLPVKLPNPPPFATGITDDVSQAFHVYSFDLRGGVRTIVNASALNPGDLVSIRHRISNASGEIRIMDLEWEYLHSSIANNASLRVRPISTLNNPGSWVDQSNQINGNGEDFAFDSLFNPVAIHNNPTNIPSLALENGIYGKLSCVYEVKVNGLKVEGGISLDPIFDGNNQLIGYNHTALSVPLGNGGFDFRGLAVSNLRVENPIFNPSEGQAQIKGDILALPATTLNYPDGWVPAGGNIFTVLRAHFLLSLLPHLLDPSNVGEPQPLELLPEPFTGPVALPIGSFPGVPGKVAEIDIPWDGFGTASGAGGGTFNVPFNGVMSIYGDCFGQSEEGDINSGILSRNKGALAVLYRCGGKNGGNIFTCPTGQPAQNGESAFYYNSLQSVQGTASLGFGWNSAASERVTEDSDGNLSYKMADGGYARWLFDGTDYNPAFPGNYIEASKDPSSGNARYTLVFKDQTVLEFNSDGRIARSLDRNGNQMVYSYDATTGFLETIDDLRGRTLHYDYGTRTDGQPVSVRANDPITGRQTQFEYLPATDPNAPHRLHRIIDPENNATEFAYDGEARISSITDPRGIVSNTFEYDEFGRLEREVQFDELEILTTYGETSGGLDFVDTITRDLSPTDPEPDRVVSTFYDLFGNPVQIRELVDPGSSIPFNLTEMRYEDPNNPYLMTARQDPNGTVVRYEYDAQGNITKLVDKAQYETVYRYADTVDLAPINPKHRNLVRFIKRPDVNVNGTLTSYPETEYQYDVNGNLEKVIDAKGEETAMTYSSDGLVEQITDRRGHISEFDYDGAPFDGISSRNLLEIRVPRGLVAADGFRRINMTYDEFDNVLTTRNDLGHISEMTFDGLDRLDTVMDARGQISRYRYSDHMLDEIELPANNGSAGQIRRTSMSYDNSGRLDQVDRDVASSGPQELRVKYGYSSFSQLKELTRIKNGAQRSFEMSFDRLGRQTSMKDPLGEEGTVAYAPFCVERAQTSARGVRRRMSFDNRCLLTQVAVGDPDASDPLELDVTREVRTFIYDELGRLGLSAQDRDMRYQESVLGIDKYVENGTNVRFYLYDELDRLTELTYEDGNTAFWEYDEEGNVTKMTDPQGGVTEYSYYRDNLLHQVIVKRAGQADRVFTYSYDAAGRLDEIQYPASTGIKAIFRDAADTPGSGFDENGNILFLRYEKNGGLIRRFEWSYDDSGNRQSQLDVTPSKAIRQEYGYDWLDRLESVRRAEAQNVGSLGALQLISVYGYDESDNRVQLDIPQLNEVFSYSYDDADNILTRTKTTSGVLSFTETFTTDVDGNMTSCTRSDTGETINLKWDDFDRLVSVSATQAGNTTRLQDNRYDVNGLRNRKLDKNGNSSLEYDVGISTAAARSGSKASDAPVISYIGGHLLLGAEVDGQLQYFLHNALSSVTDVVNEAGAVVKSYEFNEYGNLISSTGTGATAPKSFVGGASVHDDTEDSGMWLMGHRHYSPSIGRFLNRDPIGFAGGLNLFRYANGNPSTYNDPTGLRTPIAELLIGGAEVATGVTAVVADGPFPAGDAAGVPLIARGLTRMGAAAGSLIFLSGSEQESGGQLGPRTIELLGGQDADGVMSRARRMRRLREAAGQ